MLINLGYTSYFESFNDIDDEYKVIPVNDIVAFYIIPAPKRSFKKDYIRLWEDVKYAIYSPYSDRYYIRTMRNAGNVKALKSYIADNNVYLLLDKDQVEYLEKMLKRMNCKTFDQFTALVKLALQLDWIHKNNQGRVGYITSVRQIEQEIDKVKNQ